MPQLHSEAYLEREHFELFGHIACEWALVEAYLSVCIWVMAGVDWERGHIFTDDLTSAARIRLFNALAERRFNGTHHALKEAGHIFEELQALAAERNKVVHNVWAYDAGTKAVKAQKFSIRSGKFSQRELSISIGELENIVGEMAALVDRIDEFRQRFVGALPPFPERPT